MERGWFVLLAEEQSTGFTAAFHIWWRFWSKADADRQDIHHRTLAGAAYSHESYFPQPGTDPARNNAESLFGLTFSTFRFKTLNLNSQTLLFPSLSDPGRLRVTSQSNLRIELIRNFYWNFQFYENCDTRPPTNAPKNDLDFTTSLGWTF
jgi:hypothetical protein